MKPDWKSIKNDATRQDRRNILVNKTMPDQGSEAVGQLPKNTRSRGAFVFFDGYRWLTVLDSNWFHYGQYSDVLFFESGICHEIHVSKIADGR